MRKIKRLVRVLSVMWAGVLAFIAVSVTVDTYVLHGFLKLWWIAVANTTSSSPFSTDGQSNIITVIVAVTGIAILTYICMKCGLFVKEEEKDDETETVSEEKDI